MSYHLSPFGQLCFIQQPSPLYSQPTPAVRITALPPRDPRNPIWADSCCMTCAKLVGSADLFCVPCPKKGKCVRCFNLDLRCEPVREDYVHFFREVQQYFQFHDLQTAFEARKSWFDRMDGTASLLSIALFDSELHSLNRNLEQLINLQLEKGVKPPVNADGKANGESKGDMNDKVPKRRSEIQIQQESKIELEDLIVQETAKCEMQTNLILKHKMGLRVQQLERGLTLVETSIENLKRRLLFRAFDYGLLDFHQELWLYL